MIAAYAARTVGDAGPYGIKMFGSPKMRATNGRPYDSTEKHRSEF